jgi:RyR domain
MAYTIAGILRVRGSRMKYDIEAVSEKVHEQWVESKRRQGVTSRKSETGEELMVAYEQLSEAAKDLDRNSVKAVLAAIAALDGEGLRG